MRADNVPVDAAASVKCDLAMEVLRSFGTLRFAATGWSMLPTIWPGDTLVVDRVTQNQIQVGEVVLFGREGRLCAHRVVSLGSNCESPYWITQGDAMAAPDRPISDSELLGRVDHVVRDGKSIALPAKLSVMQSLIAKMIRRSFTIARVVVYLQKCLQSGVRTPEESVPPCQG